MADWKDVERLAMALPEAERRTSRGMRQWRIRQKLFVWERPLREKEILELSGGAPDGPVLGARVEHLIAREALLSDDPSVFFTTSHFAGSAAVLVQLDRISPTHLKEVVTEAWLARAPPRLVEAFLGGRSGDRGAQDGD
jgi:hypothetical protein